MGDDKKSNQDFSKAKQLGIIAWYGMEGKIL